MQCNQGCSSQVSSGLFIRRKKNTMPIIGWRWSCSQSHSIISTLFFAKKQWAQMWRLFISFAFKLVQVLKSIVIHVDDRIRKYVFHFSSQLPWLINRNANGNENYRSQMCSRQFRHCQCFSTNQIAQRTCFEDVYIGLPSHWARSCLFTACSVGPISTHNS